MAIQKGTFMRLPPKEEITPMIEEEKRHLQDLTSYLWYIMPVAEKFGQRVYDVAARSLAQDGVDVTPARLKALAAELQTPEGQARYAEERRLHILYHICG